MQANFCIEEGSDHLVVEVAMEEEVASPAAQASMATCDNWVQSEPVIFWIESKLTMNSPILAGPVTIFERQDKCLDAS